MPRICHIITTLFETSGSTRRTLAEVDHLIKKGWTVHLIVGKNACKTLITECIGKGVEVFQIRSLCKYIHPLREIDAFFQIARIVEEQKYDIVHTHLAKAGILGRFAARKAGVKAIVHTVHGPSFPKSVHWALRSLFVALERIAGRFTRAMIFVGKEIRENYMHARIADRQMSHLIYTGRDFTAYKHALNMSAGQKAAIRNRHGIQEEDIVLGCVGRIVPSKGYAVPIGAMPALLKTYPNARLIIIGKANLPEERHYELKLRRMIRELELENRIFLVDYQRDIAQYYAIMDIFLLPSHYEGLPNVILEAAVMDIPIVAFDCGGVREVFEICQGIWYLVPCGEPHAFYSALVTAVREMHSHRNNGNERASFSEIISRVWSIDGMLRKTDELYEYLLGIPSFHYPANGSDRMSMHAGTSTGG